MKKVLVLLVTAFVVTKTGAFPQKPTGSAGNHASVQSGSGSGQFYLSNDENYGLKIKHSPYVSQEDDYQQQWPKAQKLTQNYQSPQNYVAGPYCAGCAPVGSQQQFQNRPPAPQARQGLPKFETGHRNVGQQGYGYTVQHQEPQVSLRAPVPNLFSSPIWNWKSGQSQPQNQNQNQWNQPQNQNMWGRQAQQAQQVYRDPATAQHLEISQDGQYTFGYQAPQSSRQERRKQDGSVSGSYSYTDPTGHQVQVEYRASPNEGFQAVGPTVPQQGQNPTLVEQAQLQLPTPVQDTPEVLAARAEFFEAYNRQLQFIEQTRAAHGQAQAAESQNQQVKEKKPEQEGIDSGKVETENKDVPKNKEQEQTKVKQLPEQIAIPEGDNRGAEVEEDDELENDAVVIAREDEEPSTVPQAVNIPKQEMPGKASSEAGSDGTKAAFSYSLVVGGDGQNQNQQWQQPQPQPFVVGYQQPTSYGYGQDAIAQMQPQSWTVGQGQPQGSSYQLSQMVGTGQSGSAAASNTPAYFYYVSVGGVPHHTGSSELFRSNYPQSLKAHMAGSVPASGRHDAQVPRTRTSGIQNQGTRPSPPVYVDVEPMQMVQGYTAAVANKENEGKPLTLVGFIPGALVSLKNGAFVSVNSASVAHSGNGGPTSIRIHSGSGGASERFPLLVFNNQK